MAKLASIEGSFMVAFPRRAEPVEFSALYEDDKVTAWIPEATIDALAETPLKLSDITTWLSDTLQLKKQDDAGAETQIEPDDITGGMSAPVLTDIKERFEEPDIDISLAALKFVSGESFTIGVKMAPGNAKLGGIQLESITVIVTIDLKPEA